MCVAESQTAIGTWLTALVAREVITPFFSDDIIVELTDVDQVIEGREAVAEAMVELTSRPSMPGRWSPV